MEECKAKEALSSILKTVQEVNLSVDPSLPPEAQLETLREVVRTEFAHIADIAEKALEESGKGSDHENGKAEVLNLLKQIKDQVDILVVR